MAMLHIVNKSPFERINLESCLNHALAGDTILLIEDAVVGAVQGSVMTDKISASLADKKICVLAGDLAARGLSADRVISGIESVDYAGFVDLTADNEKTQSWL